MKIQYYDIENITKKNGSERRELQMRRSKLGFFKT